MSGLMKVSLFFLVATLLATLALYDNGQVSLVWQDWLLETSVSFALLIIILLFGSIYLLARLVVNVWQFPEKWRQRRKIKRYGKAESAMEKGLIAIEFGDWKTAEKQLVRSAEQSEFGLMHYLSAAKMAHNQVGKVKDAQTRRKKYIELARKHFPDQYLMIGLVEARMLSDEEPELAMLLLFELHKLHPEHKPVFIELAHQLVRNEQWQQLSAIYPDLYRQQALPKDELMLIEEQMSAGKLAQTTNLEQLESVWLNLNKGLQMQPAVLAEYVDKRLLWQQETGLATLIEKTIAKQWSDRLVFQYGQLQLGPAYERMKVAEKWLKQAPENPILLLTLGRIASLSQLWGQGQAYLKKSLAIQPTVETFHALAMCYEAEGKAEQAALIYKEAILQLEQK